MKVLYLVQEGKHAHCYGSDFLYDGFCEVLGHENVFDYPEKGPLHDGRDECGIDSDQTWPRKGHTLEEAAVQCDLAVIAMPPGGQIPGHAWNACRALKVPIAAVDASDQVRDCRGWYETVAGREVQYFKRELPIGDTWGHPLPLCYPASRIPFQDMMGRERLNRVFYYASTHGGRGPGIPRIQIADLLRQNELLVNLDIKLFEGQQREGRPTPDEYHSRMEDASIGISWNGAPNWDTNRFWENFAYGLAQVAERPKIQIPHEPSDGMHCLYASSPESVAAKVRFLLDERSLCREIAYEGHCHFRKYHTSAARARYVMEHTL